MTLAAIKESKASSRIAAAPSRANPRPQSSGVTHQPISYSNEQLGVLRRPRLEH